MTYHICLKCSPTTNPLFEGLTVDWWNGILHFREQRHNFLGAEHKLTVGRVTRKHWPPVHGPPLQTGSVDYPRTGPWTTPLDPSTDHPPNKIKSKNKDFTYCMSNRSLVSAKFRAFLRYSTLGKCDRPGFSLGWKWCHCRSLHLCHFHCCGFAWKTRKPKKSHRHFVYIWNSA